jgi:hypothetical protein
MQVTETENLQSEYRIEEGFSLLLAGLEKAQSCE